MVKGKIAQAITLTDEVTESAAGFVNPDAFRSVHRDCGWFWMLMRDPKEAIRCLHLGLSRPGHDRKQQSDILQYLTLCEALVGNLTEAKRLAAENYTSPTFRMQIAYHGGDWKVATETLEKALDKERHSGAKWNELNMLSHGVDVQRVTGDYSAAAAAFERALSLYQPDDLFFEARVRHQGVMLYFDIGQPDKAAEHRQYCGKILSGQEDWRGRAGPLWRAEAIGAALQDRFEESERFFEKSKEICRRYSLPWEEAETLHYWAKVLLKAGQLPRAREKLDAAIKIYRDYGAGQAWIDRVEADRRRAQPPSVERTLSRRADVENVAREAVFHDEGEFWTISYLDRTFRLKDMRGLHYIAHLLTHPNERFHVRELSASVGGDAFSLATSDPSIQLNREDAPPILDSKAKADYLARLSELRAELEEAEQMNDRGRAERIRQELEFVNDELSAAVGLTGRDRKMSDQAERARKRVGKAIRSALSGIREHDPLLAHHLMTCIRTGYYCAYCSDPQQPLSWKL
jgi:tetratricopeptide (TPR) repeat protein